MPPSPSTTSTSPRVVDAGTGNGAKTQPGPEAVTKPGDEHAPITPDDGEHDTTTISDEGYRAAERDLLEIMTAGAKKNDAETAIVQIGLDPLPHLAGTESDDRFWFRIHVITEDDDDDAREAATTYKKNRRLGGLKQAEDIDPVEYRSRLILAATTEFVKPKGFDDKGDPTGFDVAEENMWRSRALREALGVEQNWQIVDRVMKPGDKDRVIGKIEELAGFGIDVRETVKK